eukprot:TRINITY_DN61021_c0_g1_i1.p1 TRINITY_DN61021_c0_g1~~TRINITY_DN61021_c0_g1_i1.p1  ORF type:complete len:533 (+),score=151.26 TRINITY_DN61021_c0_g1_i1:86-1684(+)
MAPAAALAVLVLLPGAAAQTSAGVTDWCPFIEKYPSFHEWANLSQLMAGRRLSVIGFHEPPWTIINESLPEGLGWGMRYSGFEVDLWLELAAVGGFTIDYTGYRVPQGVTWTEALLEQKEKYDVIAGGGWVDTARRRRLGVTFTTGYAENGIVLAVPKPKEKKASIWETAFYFVKPFTLGAYGLTALMALGPAALVWLLERESEPGCAGVWQAQFMGALAVLGMGDFTWASRWPTRGIMVLWAFTCLVLGASYTASLTTFLVSDTAEAVAVSGAASFFDKGMIACLPKGWAASDLVRTKWSEYSGLMKDIPPAELTKGMIEGDCDGVLMGRDYARIMLSGGPPRTAPDDGGEDYGCRCQIVGNVEINGVGAFPAATSNCRWFPVQVVNALIRELGEFQRIEGIFKTAVSRATRTAEGRPRCTPGGPPPDAGTVRLSAENLVGLVVVSIPAIGCLAIVAAVASQVAGREIGVDSKALSDEGRVVQEVVDQAEHGALRKGSCNDQDDDDGDDDGDCDTERGAAPVASVGCEKAS